MNWQLEPLSTADFPFFREILLKSNLPHEDFHDEMILFTWRKGGKIAGTGALEIKGLHALLRSVSLLEAFRGQGDGRLLVAALEEEARRRGVEALYLLTNTAESFFARQGYSVIARDQAPSPIRETSEFASVCPASAVCMMKVLG